MKQTDTKKNCVACGGLKPTTEYYTAHATCKECYKESKKLSNSRYYQRNKEARRLRNIANREKQKEARRLWGERNAARVDAYNKEYRATHKEEKKAQNRAYREKQKEALLQAAFNKKSH